MRKLVLVAAVALMAGGAQAATLNVVGGQLMGASNVLVDGNLYDVQFLDGTCIDLYNGCDEYPSDFTFESHASALLASQALLDQVFLDGVQGQFDSVPGLTNGCGVGVPVCFVLTPHFVFVSQQMFLFARLRNWETNPTFSDATTPTTRSMFRYDIPSPPPGTGLDDGGAVFAVWGASVVPEPSSALLLGLGLTGLAAKGRRRNRS